MISYSFLKRCSFLFLDFLFIQLVESQPGVTILSVRNYWQVEALSLSRGAFRASPNFQPPSVP